MFNSKTLIYAKENDICSHVYDMKLFEDNSFKIRMITTESFNIIEGKYVIKKDTIFLKLNNIVYPYDSIPTKFIIDSLTNNIYPLLNETPSVDTEFVFEITEE